MLKTIIIVFILIVLFSQNEVNGTKYQTQYEDEKQLEKKISSIKEEHLDEDNCVKQELINSDYKPISIKQEPINSDNGPISIKQESVNRNNGPISIKQETISIKDEPIKGTDEQLRIGTAKIKIEQNVNEESEMDNCESEASHNSDQSISTDDQDSDEMENLNDLTNDKKKKIVKIFYKIKSNYLQLMKRNKCQKMSNVELETKVAQQIGIRRKRIRTWKRELGVQNTEIAMNFPREKKHKIVEQFIQMKDELHTKYPSKSWRDINQMITDQMPVQIGIIYRWKREFGLTFNKTYSEKDKEILMKKYSEIKRRNPKISDSKIAKKLKMGQSKLKEWKSEKISKNDSIFWKKIYSNEEKKEMLRTVDQYKQRHPELGQEKIVKKLLPISLGTFKKWKKSMRLENANENSIDNLHDDIEEEPKNMGIDHSSQIAPIINDMVWKWNRCTKKRGTKNNEIN